MRAMEESIVVNNKEEELVDLPPGFRFHPTDEEIITHYLSQKIMNPGFKACAVGEVDLNKCEPWDMPRRAKMGEKEWYFFCQKDRKYPTGTRTNRATESGYWKATGKDKEIYQAKAGGGQQLVGMKKTLVFYRGRAPKGEKTNWVMHEFRLEGKLYYNLPRPSNDDWAVCRIFHKTTGLIKKDSMVSGGDGLMRTNSYIEDDLLDYCSSPPPLIDPTCSGFTDAVEDSDFKFKGVDNNMNLSSYPPVPRSSDGNYFYFPSRSSELQDHPVYRNNNNNNYAQMMSMLMNPISSFRDPVNCSGSSFQVPGSGQMYYKADQQQLSSKHEPVISLSQDTSISADVNNTEISSSKLDNLEIFTGDSNKIEDITDMDSLWDF